MEIIQLLGWQILVAAGISPFASRRMAVLKKHPQVVSMFMVGMLHMFPIPKWYLFMAMALAVYHIRHVSELHNMHRVLASTLSDKMGISELKQFVFQLRKRN